MKTAAALAFVAAVAAEESGFVSKMEQLGLMQKKTAAHASYREQGLLPTKAFESMGAKECVDGMAGPFPCNNVHLLSYTSHYDLGSTSGEGNDVWGCTVDGQDIGIVAQTDGTTFVRIEDDGHITILGRMKPTEGEDSLWRDVKCKNGWAFGGTEATVGGIQIVNLQRLTGITSSEEADMDMKPDTTYFGEDNGIDKLTRSHNVVMNMDEEADMYLYVVGSRNICDGGLQFINVEDPNNPKWEGCFADDGYTHDAECVIYNGPDKEFQGREICFAYNEDTVTVVDVTDKSAPEMLSRVPYEKAYYTHQGALSWDHKYIFVDDELDERDQWRAGESDGKTRTIMFDVKSLRNPKYHGDFFSEFQAIDHNQYIRGTHLYQANYTAGLQIINVGGVRRTPAPRLTPVGYFDVFPNEDITIEYLGSWSVYPYFSNYVIVNGIDSGLFVLKPNVLQ